MQKFKTLHEGFLQAVSEHSQRDALDIKGQKITYQDLHQSACVLANTLIEKLSQQSRFVGIFSSRSFSAFQGVLATIYCGKAYVPIDLTASPERVLEVIRECGCNMFIVDKKAEFLLSQIVNDLESSVFIFPQAESSDIRDWPARHQVIFSNTLSAVTTFSGPLMTQEHLAYLLFTSGSTGKPKGVPISHKNICAYLTDVSRLYPLTVDDRCTQAFEFTFDPSVHDMFATWLSGACLYVMDERERLGAQYFIKKNKITVWNTLPSVLKLCLQTRSFSESYLTSLKYVFFNGEPLTERVVSELQSRANQAKLVNFYGLTETTVNLSHYLWNQQRSPQDCRNGLVPIGDFFENIRVYFLQKHDEQGKEQFELCLAGEQIFQGYLNNNNNEKLFFKDIDGTVFIKTGDLVEGNAQNDRILHVIGRSDDQVKISGHRVDLNIIRHALESVSSSLDALVLKTENSEGVVQLIGFLKGQYTDTDRIKIKVNEQMPGHMQLSEVYQVATYPYLVSGKVNKRALLEQVLGAK